LEHINYDLLIKRFRESGLKSCELADLTGISRNTISNVLYGKNTPSYYVIFHLARALQLSPFDIINIFFSYFNLSTPDDFEELTL